MKRPIFIIVLLFLTVLPGAAINPKEDPFEFGHHRIALDGALTSSCSYILEASYHYMFNHYIGIGAGLGLISIESAYQPAIF